MLNIEKEREAFSNWHESEYGEHVTWLDDVPASHIHNDRWSGWQASALRAEAKLDGCVVVPKSEATDWYFDENEYIYTDEPDIFLCDLEPGDVLEVKRQQCWQVESQFAAKVYEDEDNINWELFDSNDDAEKAAAHCKAMLEAARGGK